jgi:hypothetical protein
MLDAAHERGFAWTASPSTAVQQPGQPQAAPGLGWRWLTRLKANRRVNRDRQGSAVGATAIEAAARWSI